MSNTREHAYAQMYEGGQGFGESPELSRARSALEKARKQRQEHIEEVRDWNLDCPNLPPKQTLTVYWSEVEYWEVRVSRLKRGDYR